MFELQETVTPTLEPTKLLAPESPCTAMTGLPNTQPLTAHVNAPDVGVEISEKQDSGYSRPISTFSHICPPISQKPEFSRHSGVCGLRMPPVCCRAHVVASCRKSEHGYDRPAKYPTPTHKC